MNSNSINLYKFIGDKKEVVKNPTLIETISGDFKGTVDLLNPVIDLQPTSTSTVTKILQEANYCYVSDLHRYYYIDNMVCRPGSIIELHLTIDVLNSWATEILLLDEGIVERNAQADGSNVYLDDSEIHVYNNPNIQTYKFDYASSNVYEFGKQNFVLAVAGS